MHRIDKRCGELAVKAKAAIDKDPSRTLDILKKLYLQAIQDIEDRYKTSDAVDTDGRTKTFIAIPHEDKV